MNPRRKRDLAVIAFRIGIASILTILAAMAVIRAAQGRLP